MTGAFFPFPSFFLLLLAVLLVSSPHAHTASAFSLNKWSTATRSRNICLNGSTDTQRDESSSTKPTQKDNKAMAFLKKIGKVGGTKVDYTNAVGVDEGSGGAKVCSSNASKVDHDTALKKARHAYRSCTESGSIDDLSETFPITSSGTQWAGVTDKSVGGKSSGTLVRKSFEGRVSNVLDASISLDQDGVGFVQMVTDLALDPAVSNTVDASDYDGVELDVFYKGDAEEERFNVQ